MSDARQLPLFPSLPASTDDLNPYTRLRDTIALFQQHLGKQGKTDHTIAAFTSDLGLLAEFGGDDHSLGTYTTSDLNEFLHWLEYGRGVPCSRKSYARRVTTLKVFFKWLHEVGAIPHDPAAAILQRSGPAPLAEILSPEQVEAALAFARSLRRAEKPDLRPELLLRLLLATGIKKNETMRLTPSEIDRAKPDQPVLVVQARSAKDIYKERRIDVDPDWVRLLDEYLTMPRKGKNREFIFNCTPRNLEYILEDISTGAEIDVKISFEMLRWTCAVRDYRAGIDPDAIREKLGLSKISWHETFDKIKRLTAQQIEEEAT